jgi:hypothetical protein
MARVDENDVTLGLRGRFGKQFVFRKHGKKTIAVRRGTPTGGNTLAQNVHRDKFRLATIYAKRCLLQPEMKADYEVMARAKEMTSPFAAALGDYLSPVSIKGIVTDTYKGEAGYPLGVLVSDVYKVKTIKVMIVDASDVVIESGDAIRAEGNVGFTYITTVSIPVVAGMRVRVEVKDRPGNTVTHEVSL